MKDIKEEKHKIIKRRKEYMGFADGVGYTAICSCGKEFHSWLVEDCEKISQKHVLELNKKYYVNNSDKMKDIKEEIKNIIEGASERMNIEANPVVVAAISKLIDKECKERESAQGVMFLKELEKVKNSVGCLLNGCCIESRGKIEKLIKIIKEKYELENRE